MFKGLLRMRFLVRIIYGFVKVLNVFKFGKSKKDKKDSENPNIYTLH